MHRRPCRYGWVCTVAGLSGIGVWTRYTQRALHFDICPLLTRQTVPALEQQQDLSTLVDWERLPYRGYQYGRINTTLTQLPAWYTQCWLLYSWMRGKADLTVNFPVNVTHIGSQPLDLFSLSIDCALPQSSWRQYKHSVLQSDCWMR